MLLIFMSEHMFRSRDQSVKNTERVFQIYKHGIVFLLPTLGPDTTPCNPLNKLHRLCQWNFRKFRSFRGCVQSWTLLASHTTLSKCLHFLYLKVRMIVE